MIYPAGARRSAAVNAGAEIAIPDGAIVRTGQGCEWLVAVFSDEALDTQRVAEEIRAAPRTRAGCRVELTISGARSFRLFPIMR